MVTHRGIAVRQRKGGLEHDRSIEKRERPRHLLRCTGIDIRLGLEHEIVRVETVGPLPSDAFDFRFPNAGGNRTTADGAISSWSAKMSPELRS